ncbi:MAG TPA: hypothetical protein VIM61_13385 [Chthoniobacterales bacterium]|jgi:DNA mismatch repair ATPase MutS
MSFGFAEQSYGIQVVRLAGLPSTLIVCAKHIRLDAAADAEEPAPGPA